MIEIGKDVSARSLDEYGEKVYSVIAQMDRNKVILVGGKSLLDLDNINEIQKLAVMPYKRWRVIALGMVWTEVSTANEDPIVHFGVTGDADAFGIMTSAITGGEKFCVGDFQKLDPLGILGEEIITETSATLAITWSTGTELGVWKTGFVELEVAEAAAAAMTTGIVQPFMVIEVDTRGEW